MVTINFIPWRTLLYQYQKKSLHLLMACSGLCAFLAVLLAHIVVQNKQAQLQFEVDKQEHILLVRQQKQKINSALNNAMPLNQLRSAIAQYRVDMLNFFERLGQLQDYQICFSEIFFKDNLVTLSGNVSTAAEFTEFVKQWQAVDLFTELYIENLQHDDAQFMRFRMRALMRKDFDAKLIGWDV